MWQIKIMDEKQVQLGRCIYGVYKIHIKTFQIIDFQVISQNSKPSTFYSTADVINICFYKGKKKGVFKRTTCVYQGFHNVCLGALAVLPKQNT